MTQSLATDPQELERFRTELTGYSYRMLGSAFEADDAVQDTMVRAWKALDGFDGRSSLRTWLYRIATNVCLDMLKSRKRRALPVDLQAQPSKADGPLAPPVAESTWIEPIPDGRVLTEIDPAELIVARESVRLAFVAALQYLPPRQRVVLILRDVLKWSAAEVAELLETTTASVNSAMQRAKATLAERDEDAAHPCEALDESHTKLLNRYVEAFERYDIDSFVALLHEDAQQAMPPYPMWLLGPREIHTWMVGPGAACEGSKLIPVDVNGTPGFAQYRPSGANGRHEPWSIHVIDISNGKVAGITYFLDTNLFELFGLPAHL